MNTPVCDFVRKYSKDNTLRMHMPGHKGKSILGFEPFDITEIKGADSLYEADGIIRESEENASALFGCQTFYSTEGSSQCIRAMLYLAMLDAKSKGKKAVIAAGRNAHKTFLYAAAMLDFEIQWIYPDEDEAYLSCKIDEKKLKKLFDPDSEKPTALYLTTPDYLGNITDIKAISEICRNNGIILLVDNAHGSYLKFLPESIHPIDLGADICCDSAHKTLPVITGGAYLHISKNAPSYILSQAKNALSLFGSTSPSYLIMQSLDYANKIISDGYKEKLEETVENVKKIKAALIKYGYSLSGDEPLKITIQTKDFGYYGYEIADILESKKIFVEFSDPDYTVLMISVQTDNEELKKLEDALFTIPRKNEIKHSPPPFSVCQKIISVREAVMSESETVSVSECEGRILATPSVACPPAVPIVICGERINSDSLKLFEYYGIRKCDVIK